MTAVGGAGALSRQIAARSSRHRSTSGWTRRLAFIVRGVHVSGENFYSKESITPQQLYCFV
jgi:hypothetical protein